MQAKRIQQTWGIIFLLILSVHPVFAMDFESSQHQKPPSCQEIGEDIEKLRLNIRETWHSFYDEFSCNNEHLGGYINELDSKWNEEIHNLRDTFLSTCIYNDQHPDELRTLDALKLVRSWLDFRIIFLARNEAWLNSFVADYSFGLRIAVFVAFLYSCYRHFHALKFSFTPPAYLEGLFYLNLAYASLKPLICNYLFPGLFWMFPVRFPADFFIKESVAVRQRLFYCLLLVGFLAWSVYCFQQENGERTSGMAMPTRFAFRRQCVFQIIVWGVYSWLFAWWAVLFYQHAQIRVFGTVVNNHGVDAKVAIWQMLSRCFLIAFQAVPICAFSFLPDLFVHITYLGQGRSQGNVGVDTLL
ncbi:MAG: hypothetical protein ACPGC9_00615 [Cytophagales bacterium]